MDSTSDHAATDEMAEPLRYFTRNDGVANVIERHGANERQSVFCHPCRFSHYKDPHMRLGAVYRGAALRRDGRLALAGSRSCCSTILVRMSPSVARSGMPAALQAASTSSGERQSSQACPLARSEEHTSELQ